MTSEMIRHLETVIADRKANPRSGSYTSELFNDGIQRIAQKVGEEAVEAVVAALAQSDERLLDELADLVYHVTVLLAERGLTWSQVDAILAARHRPDSF
jgi:phosphoribosyl-ATP pyrophosphohydrolase